MRIILSLVAAILVLTGCQKKIAEETESLLTATVSSDALSPLPCHSTNFVTDYPINPGEQPPFRFTKTLFPDTRVRSINMLSRAVPNYKGYKRLMWETNGYFGYTTNQGTLTGTKELWEYYKTSTGAAARRSILKKNISLTFQFNEKGHVKYVVNNFGQWDQYSQVYRPVGALHIVYAAEVPSSNQPAEAMRNIVVLEGSDEAPAGYPRFKNYQPSNDQYGNPMYVTAPEQPINSGLQYSYNYNIPRNGRNYSFIPSQNLISFEYNLCEVMQWLPQPTHQRTFVVGFFWLEDQTQIIQRQEMRNYKFDAKGNQVSLTYNDQVLQKTTWYCK